MVFSSVMAQRQTYNWYFGNYAGLDFNGTSVKPLKNGKLNTVEGCATISDRNGKLLFYTDGVTVWNNVNIMANGTGLKGDFSTTQSSIIIPYPENDSLYYIFSMGVEGGDLYYSIVNINRNDGLGQVITKNVLLLDACTEKLIAVRHSNKKDFWIITHKWLSDKFYSYLVTSSGVNTIPVISQSSTIHDLSAKGYMKISNSNKRIALAIDETGGLELYDFDNSTGIINNPMILFKYSNGPANPYGLEFSPDDKLLYVSFSEWANSYTNQLTVISQFDLSSYNRTDIINSKIDLIKRNTYFHVSNGALQLAPDKRIYIAVIGSDSIGVIENPNIKGIGCKATFNGLYLDGREGTLGLPNFPPFLMECDSIPPIVQDTTVCYGKAISIGLYTDPGIHYTWQDGSNGYYYPVNTSGKYWVEKGKWECFRTDTFHVYYYPEIKVDLGINKTLCYGQTMEFNIQEDSASIRWQNQSNASYFLVETEGKYSVTVSKKGCSVSDAVDIKYQLCCDQLLFPNLITLNGDNKNDQLFISELPANATTFQVFNSWGDRVYENNKFNGYWEPENINEGVYFYILKDNNSNECCKSWVEIIK